MFFRLLVELADGEENLVARLEETPQIRYFPHHSSSYNAATSLLFAVSTSNLAGTSSSASLLTTLSSIFLHRCKQMILQYTIVKPFLAVATFVCQITNTYDEGSFAIGSGYLWVTLVYNVSISVSFLHLFFYFLFP